MALQGTLDGLCGPYAIVNAYHQCDIEEGWLGQDISISRATRSAPGRRFSGKEPRSGR